MVSSLAYSFFANNDICMVWSMLAELQTPPIVTTDLLYLRFIGDRSIQEKDFGRIQVDRVFEMQKLANNIKTVEDERIKLAIIAANNHMLDLGLELRMYFGICWDYQMPNGKTGKRV